MESENDTEIVDETPEYSNAKRYSDYTMGDPQVEYGVVDTNQSYPSETKYWTPEFPRDAPREKHLVVAFEVVARGFERSQAARVAAERRNEDEHGDRYQVVMLSDTRGL